MVLDATAAEIRDRLAEVKRLQTIIEQWQAYWRAASKDDRADARTIWETAEKQLVAAQQDLAALRSKEQILVGKLASPGEGSSKYRLACGLYSNY